MTDRSTALPRTRWAAALVALPSARVLAAGNAIAATAMVQHRRVPQAGLALLTLADGVFGESWHLGEIPVSQAFVEVHADGRVALGGAQVLADDPALATACALCDAVLSEQLPGWEVVAELVAVGARVLAGRDHARAGMLARTRAEFAALDDDGNDDE